MISQAAGSSGSNEVGATNSRRLAGLIGPVLIAFTTSELVNLDFLERQYRYYSYVNGCFVFVAGLLIVRSHNRWARDWSVLVTLTGWVGMLLGLFRMFAPEAKQGGASIPTFIGMAIPFAVGVFLTFKGYWPSDRRTDAHGAFGPDRERYPRSRIPDVAGSVPDTDGGETS